MFEAVATTGRYTSTEVDPNVSNNSASTLTKSVPRRSVAKRGSRGIRTGEGSANLVRGEADTPGLRAVTSQKLTSPR